MLELFMRQEVPLWVLIAWYVFNLIVQTMPEPKDTPLGWWYQWLFDVAHAPAGNWALIAKAYRAKRNSRLLG